MREVDITQKTSGIITEKTTLQTVAYALYKYLIGTVTISRNTDTVSRNYKIKMSKLSIILLGSPQSVVLLFTSK